MLKHWNVLALLGLMALALAAGCAQDDTDADADEGGTASQAPPTSDDPNGPQIGEMMDAGGAGD